MRDVSELSYEEIVYCENEWKKQVKEKKLKFSGEDGKELSLLLFMKAYAAGIDKPIAREA
jgi:hypothetical protein